MYLYLKKIINNAYYNNAMYTYYLYSYYLMLMNTYHRFRIVLTRTHNNIIIIMYLVNNLSFIVLHPYSLGFNLCEMKTVTSTVKFNTARKILLSIYGCLSTAITLFTLYNIVRKQLGFDPKKKLKNRKNNTR